MVEKYIQKLLIGVFVSNSAIRKLQAQQNPFGIINLCHANREANTTLFFFAIKDVNLENKTITGTYLNDDKQMWETNIYPFPDVVYNRRSEGNMLTPGYN